MRGIVVDLLAQCDLRILSELRRNGNMRDRNLRWLVDVPRFEHLSRRSGLHAAADLRKHSGMRAADHEWITVVSWFCYVFGVLHLFAGDLRGD